MPSDLPEDRRTLDDTEAITKVCQLYIEGSRKGDASLLRRAFHSDARVFGRAGERRFDVPIDRFIPIACESPLGVGNKYRAQVVSVHRTGDAAAAVIAEDGYWGQVSFVDYMSMAQFGSEWKIVSKTFAHTCGKMPG